MIQKKIISNIALISLFSRRNINGGSSCQVQLRNIIWRLHKVAPSTWLSSKISCRSRNKSWSSKTSKLSRDCLSMTTNSNWSRTWKRKSSLTSETLLLFQWRYSYNWSSSRADFWRHSQCCVKASENIFSLNLRTSSILLSRNLRKPTRGISNSIVCIYGRVRLHTEASRVRE